MTVFEILGQVCGFVSLGFYVTAYQMKKTKHTQLLFVPADIFCGFQYLFLGSINSFLLLCFAALRDFAGAFATDKVLRYVAIAYLVTVWVIGFFKIEYWPEILPLIGTTLATFAVLQRGHFYRFRFLMFLHHIMWMWFNIWIMSLAGIVLVIINGSSNLIGAWRYWRGNKTLAAETLPIEV